MLKDLLVRFDELWTTYEKKYVYELMVIESDARRFIIESINIEAVLQQDHMQLPAMREQLNEKRSMLIENICSVNAVANQEGKGRDDFTFSLLLQAEQLNKPNSHNMRVYSKAVDKLASRIRATFASYRELMRKYQTNIELVDP